MARVSCFEKSMRLQMYQFLDFSHRNENVLKVGKMVGVYGVDSLATGLTIFRKTSTDLINIIELTEKGCNN